MANPVAKDRVVDGRVISLVYRPENVPCFEDSRTAPEAAGDRQLRRGDGVLLRPLPGADPGSERRGGSGLAAARAGATPCGQRDQGPRPGGRARRRGNLGVGWVGPDLGLARGRGGGWRAGVV